MTIADRAVLVTGANRGIGQALVEEALRRGVKRVYATTRQPLAHSDGRVTPLTLDVTNAAQIQEAVEQLFKVKVERVRTMVVPGKLRRRGKYSGYRSDWKKAYVTLREGEKMIEYGESF